MGALCTPELIMGRSRLYRFVDSTIDAVETRVAALGGQAASSGSTEWVSHVTLYSPSNAPQIGMLVERVRR